MEKFEGGLELNTFEFVRRPQRYPLSYRDFCNDGKRQAYWILSKEWVILERAKIVWPQQGLNQQQRVRKLQDWRCIPLHHRGKEKNMGTNDEMMGVIGRRGNMFL